MSLTYPQRQQAFNQIARVVVSNRFCYLASSPNLLFSVLNIDGTLEASLNKVMAMVQQIAGSMVPPTIEEILPAAKDLINILPGSTICNSFLQLLCTLETKEDTEAWLADAWVKLSGVFGVQQVALEPWVNTGPTFERNINYPLSAHFYEKTTYDDFDQDSGLVIIEKSTMTPSVRLLSSQEANRTPGTFLRAHGVTGLHSLDSNAVDAVDWCDYVLSNLYHYAEQEITPDACRATLGRHNITTDNITQDELLMLRKITSDILANSVIFNGNAQLVPLDDPKHANKWRYIKMRTDQWEGREAFSFNSDGFIGVAGWASTKNLQPLCQALCKWAEVVSSKRLHSTNHNQRELSYEML